MRAHSYPPKGREHRADRLWIIVVFSPPRVPEKQKKLQERSAQIRQFHELRY